jgi:hypothetical protein
MTMAKILGFALGLFFAFASSGYAADVLYHGSLCNTTLLTTAPAAQIVYNQWGVANISSSSSLTVNCGGVVAFTGAGGIQGVYVHVYDRNGSQNVVCTLRTVALDGTPTAIRTASSSFSSASVQFLDISPPAVQILTTINIECTIPPSTASGFSHVTTYRVISTP